MQKPDKTKTPSRSTAATAECCTELTCESGLRNRYYEGKRLTPDMFRVEQEYLNERRRLLNRAIHGWGVVYGYSIALHHGKSARKEQAETWLQIGNGLALDECGRELLHIGRDVAMNELIALDDQGRQTDLDTLLTPPKEAASAKTPNSLVGGSRPNLAAGRAPGAVAIAQGGLDPQIVRPRTDGEPKKTCWMLSVHYAEQRTGAVTLKDPCSCDRDEWDHICETVRFSLRRVSCDECCVGCTCGWTCSCATGTCCCDHAEPDDKDRTGRDLPPLFQRGGCRCLCDHLTALGFSDCDGRLCEIKEPCARVWVDVKHGVPIACLEIEADDCGGWTIGEVDACGPRRLVKRNDVLFDLVRGCDLTYISDFGWKEWHREPQEVPFDTFAEAIAPDDQEQYEYVTVKFWVRFSRPVRRETLTADCFSFTVLSIEREGRWRSVQRVPITSLKYIPAQPNDPDDHVRGAYIAVDGGWVEDGLWGRGSVFFDNTWVEIEVRGDFILDCNGQPIDANAVGRAKHRTGNGTPGGTFLSTFHVGPRLPPPHGKPGPGDKQYPAKGAAS